MADLRELIMKWRIAAKNAGKARAKAFTRCADELERALAAQPAPEQCCVCGKRFDARERENGGGPDGCELTDGRWACSSDCFELAAQPAPIPMILYCPVCGTQHIDAPDDRTAGWTNPSHRSHLCHGCGCIWRPADVATVGVAKIETRGKADTFDQREAAQPATVPEGDGREAFESWVGRRWGLSLSRWEDSGEYTHHQTRNFWQCWTASRNALLAAAPAPATVKDSLTAEKPEAQAGADVTDAMIDAGYAAMHRISVAASPRDRLTAMWVAMNAAMPKPAEGGALIGYVWPTQVDYDHIRRLFGKDGDAAIKRVPSGAIGVYVGASTAGSGEAVASRLDRMADDRETIGYDCEAECLRSAAELVRQEERRLAGGEGE